jgi:pyridoxine 5-phosphate synthase
MVKLSVNINKIATIRNARGGNIPDVTKAALDCERFGAHGITVHPRPDQRHIRYSDVNDIRPKLSTEFNIEGYPNEIFLNLIKTVKPDQATLVPDPPDAITSNAGWNTKTHLYFLKDIIQIIKNEGVRTSIFVEPNIEVIDYAKKCGTDRIELYTEDFAKYYPINPLKAIKEYKIAAEHAKKIGLGINAGHDLSLENLNYFISEIPFIDEVSIGHALISDALYLGLENTIQLYLKCLNTEKK